MQSPSTPILTIAGLGPGDPGQMSCAVWEELRAADCILLRTRIHPTVSYLEEQGLRMESCDDLYENSASFEETYSRIAERALDICISLAARQPGARLVFAVPGHPLMGERSVGILLQRARESGVEIRLQPSPGFLDALLPAIGLDLGTGLAVLDATCAQPLPAGIPVVYYQVYNQLVASDLKLLLLESLPPETPIWHVRAAGAPEEQVTRIPLFALDRQECDHLTSVVLVPPDQQGQEVVRFPEASDLPEGASTIVSALEDESSEGDFYQLVALMDTLRSPGGCPWDREQDHQTLRRYVLEEAYEVVDCIDRGDLEHLPEELGDLLLQVVFHAQMASEEGRFDIADVITSICQKLFRRHPHVFADTSVDGSEQVIHNWEAIKRAEKVAAAGQIETGLMDDIPVGLPALTRADKVFRKAAKVGFDWPDAAGALEKVAEELHEIHRAIDEGKPGEIASEVGDLLMAVTNAARKLGLDPEETAREALNRFLQRFRAMEEMARAAGTTLGKLDLDSQEELWQRAKKLEP